MSAYCSTGPVDAPGTGAGRLIAQALCAAGSMDTAPSHPGGPLRSELISTMARTLHNY